MFEARSAKQLTFLYFSIVAVAIITIHATVLDSTLEGIEKLSIQNRLLLQEESILEKAKEQGDYSVFKIDEFTTAYTDKLLLPHKINAHQTFPVNEAIEIYKTTTGETEYFLLRLYDAESKKSVYLIHNDIAFELGEENIMGTQATQSLTSLSLLIVSLLVVMRIADRLTAPVSAFSEQLRNRKPDDLSPLVLPKGIATKELLQLVDSFNTNQEDKNALIERERAFNRMASHELRSPLMVMKGATNLLSYSNDPEFIKKQQDRLNGAVTEMNDFIDALLSLTKSEKDLALEPRFLTEVEVNNIIDAHSALLSDKPVEVNLEVLFEPNIQMPEPAFKLLLGNILKNAFAYTNEGEISITIDKSKLTVSDTGVGLENKLDNIESHGLGLLIARDICRKYHWQIELSSNINAGCTAVLAFS